MKERVTVLILILMVLAVLTPTPLNKVCGFASVVLYLMVIFDNTNMDDDKDNKEKLINEFITQLNTIQQEINASCDSVEEQQRLKGIRKRLTKELHRTVVGKDIYNE